MSEQRPAQEPFLFRFKEVIAVGQTNLIQPSKANGATNPIEDRPPPEPTKKTPWGD